MKKNSGKSLEKAIYREYGRKNNIDFSNMDDKGFELLLQAICKMAKQDLVTELKAGCNGKVIQEFFHRVVPEVADEIIRLCYEECNQDYNAYKTKAEAREAKEKIAIELFSKGYSKKYISKQSGLSTDTVDRIGKKNGFIDVNSKYAHKYYPRLSDEIKEKAREILDKKYRNEIQISDLTIAKKVGISITTLYRIKGELGYAH